MEILAIITARAGSKGMPDKNISVMCGHPLIAYSIATALQAELVSRVICSTDSPEIATVAAGYGAEVPFLRPVEFAQDDSTDLQVFQHALGWMRDSEGYVADLVVHLRPTAPIRFEGDLDKGIRLLADAPECESVRAVIPAPANPYKMWRSDSSGLLKPLLQVPGTREPFNSPRQMLPEVWWQTGMLDIVRYSTITKKDSMSGDKILPFMANSQYTFDIDNKHSFNACELVMREVTCIRPQYIES